MRQSPVRTLASPEGSGMRAPATRSYVRILAFVPDSAGDPEIVAAHDTCNVSFRVTTLRQQRRNLLELLGLDPSEGRPFVLGPQRVVGAAFCDLAVANLLIEDMIEAVADELCADHLREVVDVLDGHGRAVVLRAGQETRHTRNADEATAFSH